MCVHVCLCVFVCLWSSVSDTADQFGCLPHAAKFSLARRPWLQPGMNATVGPFGRIQTYIHTLTLTCILTYTNWNTHTHTHWQSQQSCLAKFLSCFFCLMRKCESINYRQTSTHKHTHTHLQQSGLSLSVLLLCGTQSGAPRPRPRPRARPMCRYFMVATQKSNENVCILFRGSWRHHPIDELKLWVCV